jgi:hypothetical protein
MTQIHVCSSRAEHPAALARRRLVEVRQGVIDNGACICRIRGEISLVAKEALELCIELLVHFNLASYDWFL